MLTKNFLNKKKCSGCGICAGICPANAIKMSLTENGFYRPDIDQSKCKNCGICKTICLENTNLQLSEPAKFDKIFGNYLGCYGAYAKDSVIRKNGSTAGVIRAIANFYSDKFDGILALAENENDPLKPKDVVIKNNLDILKMSKSIYYVVERSNAANFLRQNKGNYLVIGTPCQIAGLNNSKKYLKANFTSIEIFCGGLYSTNLMQNYFKIKNCNPSKIDFRDKASGWHNFSLSLYDNEILGNKIGTISQKIVKTRCNDDEFYYAQRNKIFTQEKCLKCEIAHTGCADIMVGDFWGEKYKDNDLGVNLVIARTKKGLSLIKNCRDIVIEDCSIDDVYKSQPWFIKFHERNRYLGSSLKDKLLNIFHPQSLPSAIYINNKMQKYAFKKNFISKHKKIVRRLKTRYKILLQIIKYIPNIRKDKVLIIPPDCTFGGFGDQAMVVSLIEQLKHFYKESNINILMLHKYNQDGILNRYNLNVKIYYPDENQSLNSLIKILAPQTKHLYVIGADILDGGCGINNSLNYFSIIKKFAKYNVKISTTGFSFNDKNYPEILEGIKSISKYTNLNVRDNISYNRLKNINCKNINLTADIAFLFDENKYTTSVFCDRLSSILKKYKSKKRCKKIIGLHLTWKKEEEEVFLNKIIQAAAKHKDCLFVILPHDLRVYENILPDKYFSDKLEQFLIDNKISYINAYKLANEIDVKTIVKELDLVITSRMHLAIASFSRNIPVISFVYQGKFEGLYAFYDFDENLMFDKNTFEVDELNTAINYLLNDFNYQKMSENNLKIFELAKRNLNMEACEQ